MKEMQMEFSQGFEHFLSRQLLQTSTKAVCTQEIYDNCFSKCPPQIPGPPPPPASLEGYSRTWCTGHSDPWQCTDTTSGPEIYGTNPRLQQATEPSKVDEATVIALSVILPILVIVFVVVAFLLWKRRKGNKHTTDNTYNLGYLSKPQAPTWTENDPTEGAVEDGSEIFYQVDRTAAYTANMNGAGNSRSVPDVVHSSSATLRKTSPNTPSVFDIGRSGSATSQAPLLSSPEIASHNKRRMLTRTGSGGQDAADSDLGSPLYSRYGATSSQQPASRMHSHEPIMRGASSTALISNPGYMTYTPSTKSHPALYNGDRTDGTGTVIRTPKVVRQRSLSGNDQNKPRQLRRPSGAAAVQRSDSMTLNRAAGRENYKNNWENFDEVTATMRRNKGEPAHRELVLGTDSFIDSFTNPEPEEATSVDQLGLPTRNPFLQGYYEYDDAANDSTMQEETSFGERRNSDDVVFRPDVEHPPSYDDVIPPPRRSSSVTMSQMPTLDLRACRDRISEYDSEDSVEV